MKTGLQAYVQERWLHCELNPFKGRTQAEGGAGESLGLATPGPDPLPPTQKQNRGEKSPLSSVAFLALWMTGIFGK